MKKKILMNPAIDFYESIVNKTVILADDFYGSDTYKHYCHSDSIHSFTKAFGTPQPRFCCFCSKVVGVKFLLGKVANTYQNRSRYLLKLIATWQDWKQYTHPVKIILNSHNIFDGQLFLENVSKGWPSIYFTVPPQYFAAENELEIANKSGGKNTLLVERVELLQLKDAKDFTVQYCPEFISRGTEFTVKLVLLSKHWDISVKYPKHELEFIKHNGCDFVFKARHAAKNVKLIFESNKSQCAALISEIHEPQSGREVLVGMDCDDYRQDGTQEMDRILEHFAYTQMGNLVVFRPKPNRNYPVKFPASLEDWVRWIDFCRKNKIKFQFSGLPEISKKEMKILKKEIVIRGGKDFAGFQIHEPYCKSFSPVLDNPATIKNAKNFEEKKQTYIEFINSLIDDVKYGSAKMFCGDPSLLCTYLPESKIDNILCEPVSNSALLYGAARGTGKDFGAHLAPDWYCGFPHDSQAINRLSLLLDMIYAYGGKHIYVESAAFKTNAFARNDWEDEFCIMVRQKLRDFYRFTCKDARKGKPQVDLAFIYGNLESMFWRYDDRIPELSDSGNWDDFVWGKWPNTQSRRLWKATDAWLPPLDFEAFGKNESLTKMFCGTPYGSVDVVSPYLDLSSYKAIAFLGWNTMDEKIYKNLISYVNSGGILFICGCHFDTRIDFKGDPQFIRNGKLYDLIGADILGSGPKVFNKFSTCRLDNITARQIQEFLFEYTLGKGKVYFFNFYDYPYDQRLIKIIKNILEEIGKQIRKDSRLSIEGPNSKYINYTVWNEGKNAKLYLVNIDWQHKKSKKIVIRDRSKKIPVYIPDGKMLTVLL
jgi:hypothetical protein